MAVDARNFHIQYPNVSNQHWHVGSGRYAGGDHLMTAVVDGWEIEKCVQYVHTYNGARSVAVYEFTLTREGEVVKMPVISNPYIERFIVINRLDVSQPTGADSNEAA